MGYDTTVKAQDYRGRWKCKFFLHFYWIIRENWRGEFRAGKTPPCSTLRWGACEWCGSLVLLPWDTHGVFDLGCMPGPRGAGMLPASRNWQWESTPCSWSTWCGHVARIEELAMGEHALFMVHVVRACCPHRLCEARAACARLRRRLAASDAGQRRRKIQQSLCACPAACATPYLHFPPPFLLPCPTSYPPEL